MYLKAKMSCAKISFSPQSTKVQIFCDESPKFKNENILKKDLIFLLNELMKLHFKNDQNI